MKKSTRKERQRTNKDLKRRRGRAQGKEKERKR
jgi:hypothetical protein